MIFGIKADFAMILCYILFWFVMVMFNSKVNPFIPSGRKAAYGTYILLALIVPLLLFIPFKISLGNNGEQFGIFNGFFMTVSIVCGIMVLLLYTFISSNLVRSIRFTKVKFKKNNIEVIRKDGVIIGLKKTSGKPAVKKPSITTKSTPVKKEVKKQTSNKIR